MEESVCFSVLAMFLAMLAICMVPYVLQHWIYIVPMLLCALNACVALSFAIESITSQNNK